MNGKEDGYGTEHIVLTVGASHRRVPTTARNIDYMLADQGVDDFGGEVMTRRPVAKSAIIIETPRQHDTLVWATQLQGDNTGNGRSPRHPQSLPFKTAV
jgi:hypothetical protein